MDIVFLLSYLAKRKNQRIIPIWWKYSNVCHLHRFYSTKYCGDIERKSAAASKAPALLRWKENIWGNLMEISLSDPGDGEGWQSWLCETSRPNHPPSVSTNESPECWQFPPGLPARGSEASRGSSPTSPGPGQRRAQTGNECRNVNIKYVRGEERDDGPGVVLMCDTVPTVLRCPAVRETPSCGGRLSGGARVGGRHRVTSRGEHSGNTVSQSVSQSVSPYSVDTEYYSDTDQDITVSSHIIQLHHHTVIPSTDYRLSSQ